MTPPGGTQCTRTVRSQSHGHQTPSPDMCRFMDFLFPRRIVPLTQWTFRSLDVSSLDDSFPGSFVLWTFRSTGRRFCRFVLRRRFWVGLCWSMPTCEAGYAKHTLLLEPSIKCHCQLQRYTVSDAKFKCQKCTIVKNFMERLQCPPDPVAGGETARCPLAK